METKNEPELKIYYQPIVQPMFFKIIGYEAHARLSEKGLGVISQDIFFPLAEKAGLGVTLGKWLFEEVCVCVKKMISREREFEYISVDMLTGQLKRKSIVKDLLNKTKEIGVPPDKICIEIHEDFFNLRADIAVARIEELKNAGFKITLDNYSATYLALTKLDTVPIDIIKIAKPLIDRMVIDEKAMANISAIINRAHELEIEVLADAVETKEQQLALMELRCQKMQGPLFGKPINAREVYKPRLAKIAQEG